MSKVLTTTLKSKDIYYLRCNNKIYTGEIYTPYYRLSLHQCDNKNIIFVEKDYVFNCVRCKNNPIYKFKINSNSRLESACTVCIKFNMAIPPSSYLNTDMFCFFPNSIEI